MDSRENLAAYLKKDSYLKQDEVDLICGYFKQEFLGKDEPLLVAGNKFKKIVFVSEGILRVYVIDNSGEEIVKNFIEPKSFFADIESLEKNHGSPVNVSAVTDCILLTLSKPDSEELARKLPKWEYLMKVGAMLAMNEMIRKLEFLRLGDSTDQYKYMLKHFPLLVQQVPLKFIASFLHITQSSLSRIRRQTG